MVRARVLGAEIGCGFRNFGSQSFVRPSVSELDYLHLFGRVTEEDLRAAAAGKVNFFEVKNYQVYPFRGGGVGFKIKTC